MDYKNRLDDMGETMVKIATNAQDNLLDPADLGKLAEMIDDFKSTINSELLANKIASDSQHGWWTVKYYEANPLFEGDKADEETKKLFAAQMRAGREIRKMKSNSRGGYKNVGHRFGNKNNHFGGFDNGGGAGGSGYSGGGGGSRGAGSSGVPFGRGGYNNVAPVKPVIICYKCHKPGHNQYQCPDIFNKT